MAPRSPAEPLPPRPRSGFQWRLQKGEALHWSPGGLFAGLVADIVFLLPSETDISETGQLQESQ